ncbi:MAG TPA: hypothetical protein VLK25_02540 [Allosphingosinicella sp.]|nr:hypothetical protein [Allosphingosinicella sp.]
MGKTRHWLLLAFGSLVILAAAASAAQAASLVEHNAIPDVEQQWTAASFSSMLESGGPPEFGRCIKTVGGAYEDSGCTTTGTGKSYEWFPAFGSSQPLEKAGFSNSIKEGTTAQLETVTKNLVTCEGESASGKYTGNKTVGSVIVTFTGCTSFGTNCNSEGAATGTVVTYSLEGVLGVEELGAEPALDKIGESLFPVGHSGPLAELKCGGVPMTISGSIISPVSTNAMKLTAQVKSKAAKGKQKPESFVGGPTEVLITTIEGGTPEQAGESLTTIQTNEEKLEINSVL